MRRGWVRLPYVLQRPEQGWSSLALLLGMLVLIGVSVAAARPLTIGDTDPSTSLVVMMVAAGLVGYLLARGRIGVVRAHVMGAAAGAVLLLSIGVGAAELVRETHGAVWAEVDGQLGAMDELRLRLGLLREAIRDSFDAYQVSREGGGAISTPTEVTFLVLGAVLWTTAQFSAFSVFRYDRGGPAVMAIGVVLFLNIGLDTPSGVVEPLPPLPQLALFSALAMLLLMRLQLTQQGYQWARRHIADTGEVGRLFLRTGVLFVAFSVAGASTLTIAANAGAQELPDLGGLEDTLDDLGRQVAELLPIIGAPPSQSGPRSIGGDFEVALDWEEEPGIAFTADVGGYPGSVYWWGSAHDEFDGFNWLTSDGGRRRVAAEEAIVMSPIDGGARVFFEATIVPDAQWFAATVMSPAAVSQVTQDVRLSRIDRGGDVGFVELDDVRDDVEPYRVRANVRDYSGSSLTLTANQLRAAGRGYPEWVLDHYLQGRGPDSPASGRRTRAKATELMAVHDENPYDMALALQDELAAMDYWTEMSTVCGDGQNLPECVLEHQRGFCQLYASTMVMVLREAGVPSRLIRGFLPGERQDDGSWVVENAAYHAWVEVFFPDYGWVRFDPTPGQVQDRYDLAQTSLPEGAEDPDGGPQPTIGPLPSFSIPPTEEPFAEPSGLGAAPTCEELGTCSEDDDALAALIIGGGIAGLLLVTVFGLLFFRFRRLAEPSGGIAYRGIVSLATRLGLGPHPSQTEYEYAGTLSEVIPTVRDDLYLVAETRVETVYGQRTLDQGRRASLRRAYARIRTALLRLSLRRKR